MNTAGKRLRDAVRYLVVAHGTLNATTRPCGTPLSLPHAYALLELLHSTDGISITELAERLSIDRSNVSRLCAKMEKVGDVRVQVSPQDARARKIGLTAQGRRLAERVDESSSKYFGDLADQLEQGADPVIRALRQLAKAMGSSENANKESEG